jgi:hypothetical protein
MAVTYRHKIERVTRDLASKLIKDLNVRNRKVCESHVYTLSQDIGASRFIVNPHPIVIHEDKKRATIRLIDGQHRLIAASRSAPDGGVEMMFCYAQGSESEVQDLQATIDSGKPRNTSDRGGFFALGLPQGFVEKSARLFTVVGAPAYGTKGEVYGWMNAPKASYTACKEFAQDTYKQMHEALSIANEHYIATFKETKIKKEYLALVYLIAIMNAVELDDLHLFAQEAADPRSVLACKIREVWSDNHPFREKCKEGSKNTSGIQTLLIKDLLQKFISNELTADFAPILDSKQVEGTMFAEFELN